MESRLTWDMDPMAEGYLVRHKVGEVFNELVRIENRNLTTIVIPDAQKGIENHYIVSFYHKKGNEYCIYREENFYCYVTSKGLVVYKYPIPKLKKAERAGNSVKIEWERVSDQVAYVVARKVQRGGWVRIGMTCENNYVDHEIDIKQKYAYTVRCVSHDGKSDLSSCSYKGISV